MANFDDWVAKINGIISDATVAENIATILEENGSEAVFNFVSEIYTNNYDLMFGIYFIINIKNPTDRNLILLCRYLKNYTNNIKSLKNYADNKKIIEDLQKISRNIYKYSENTQFLFAQTLEYMWAFGYNGLETMIVNLYNKIDCSDMYFDTTNYIAKKLSCVYIADRDNIFSIFSICKEMKREIENLKNRSLMGLCLYYLGIAEICKKRLFYRPDELPQFTNSDTKNYMKKSAKHGCKFAITYLYHRGLNSETPICLNFCDNNQLFQDNGTMQI